MDQTQSGRIVLSSELKKKCKVLQTIPAVVLGALSHIVGLMDN